MFPTWLFEQIDNRDNGSLLIEEVRRQGCKTVVLKDRAVLYDPIAAHWPKELAKDEFCIAHGSLNLCNSIRYAVEEFKPQPGIWDNRAAVAYDKFHGPLQEWLLNDSCLFLPWNTVKKDYRTLFETHPRLFIKPAACDKAFGGCTVDLPGWPDFVKYAQKANGRHIDGDDIIVIAPATEITKPIEREWRFYVLQSGGVVTGSQYRADGTTMYSPLVEEGAHELADLVSQQGLIVDPIYVVDICRIGGEYKVVELGTFSPSGIYMPDLECLVSTVNQLCEITYG